MEKKLCPCYYDDTEDYETLDELDDDAKEIIAERGHLKEFYVLHFNFRTGCGDYESVNYNFKNWEDVLKEYNETEPRDKEDLVEIIYTCEEVDEDGEELYDNREMLTKRLK